MKDILTFDTKKAHEFFLEKISFLIGPFALKRLIEDDINEINIVDVRKYDDYIDGHIPFAIHVPYDDIEEHYMMFEKNKVNVIYTYSHYCSLATKAACKAAQKGYPVVVFEGGYKVWEKLGYDTVRNSSEE